MNQGIWQPFSELFRERYGVNVSVRCLDLPGFGTEHETRLDDYSIASVSHWLAGKLCKPSVLVGWSMGGLLAQYLASTGHQHALAHIQIASSPCFVEQDNWPGIKKNVLSVFAKQLKVDHEVLLRRFLMLQNMGLSTPKFSVNTMLNLLTQHPLSSVQALEQSLALLHSTDLRDILAHSNIPCQRIYGGLDSLVPSKLVERMNTMCINSTSSVVEKASHAPFLSHPEAIFDVISAFLYETFGLSRL